ncbi:DMT family transporter [Shimia litoralis]|uniref:DMT family transporter n=1 Tax=Shimia litoralis TaxID=420403 RepID=A0A4V6F1X3_9RHOB|nr:DMT family transporter [Shimia litoralis]TKZ20641.1 DMT family transporter [Shimia litoralis]
MQNVQGILLVVLAMAGFTLEDLFIKKLSVSLPTGQILIILGVFSSAIFAGIAIAKGQSLVARAAWGRAALIRACSEAMAAMSFASALALVDISTVAAVFQAMPLVITMGAAIFLGEHVGWRRWSAIGVGFAGVLCIIRPGFSSFEPATLLVIVAVFSVALRDLITRKIDASVSAYVVSFQGFGSLVFAGAILLLFTDKPTVAPDVAQSAMFAGAVLFGTMGYWGIVTAMRVADASVVAPYRYSRLVFSILVGTIFLNERPDVATLFGASLIIGSGLYTFLRERRLAAHPIEVA